MSVRAITPNDIEQKKKKKKNNFRKLFLLVDSFLTLLDIKARRRRQWRRRRRWMEEVHEGQWEFISKVKKGVFSRSVQRKEEYSFLLCIKFTRIMVITLLTLYPLSLPLVVVVVISVREKGTVFSCLVGIQRRDIKWRWGKFIKITMNIYTTVTIELGQHSFAFSSRWTFHKNFSSLFCVLRIITITICDANVDNETLSLTISIRD